MQRQRAAGPNMANATALSILCSKANISSCFLVFLYFTIVCSILDHCYKNVNHLVFTIVMNN